MKRIVYTFILFFLLIDISLANPALILREENLPPEFEATYDVYKGNVHVGETRISLRKVKDELIYKSYTIPVGIAVLFLGPQEITDHAVLKLIGKSYRVLEFKHEIKGDDKNRIAHYQFDWDNNTANVRYKDRETILDITPYTFDNFSVQLLLMRKPNAKLKTKYPVIAKGRLENHIYKPKANETMETNLGKVIANKYIREKNNKKKTTYLGWYAESLNHIPVKLDKIENGEVDTSIQITAVHWI